MKGVVLAGGQGTRLRPVTRVTNKHMVPILNKPMILYPIETLKTLGVTNILIVTGGEHVGDIAEFMGDGSEFGVTLTYKVQKDAGGIAQALGLAKDFVGDDRCAVILGDNVFDNSTLPQLRFNNKHEACIFTTKDVDDMRRFGVYRNGLIIEKPKDLQDGDAAVTGLYVYPPSVFAVVATLEPSGRGELEITDVNNNYLKAGLCLTYELDAETFWSDAGTPESLYRAIQYVAVNEHKLSTT